MTDHPEDFCDRCGAPNVPWTAPSPLWNKVMRDNDINVVDRYSVVCPSCFVRCAVEVGLPAKGWRLTLHPEPDGLVYQTPSGRVWDPEAWLWIDSPPREQQGDAMTTQPTQPAEPDATARLNAPIHAREVMAMQIGKARGKQYGGADEREIADTLVKAGLALVPVSVSGDSPVGGRDV